MKSLLKDGDLWLLCMLIGAGALPVLADVLHDRKLGAEATLGALVCVLAAVALCRRVLLLLRTRALARRLTCAAARSR